MSKQLPSPVAFAKPGNGGPSPVTLMDEQRFRPTPVSNDEALAVLAENERRRMKHPDRPTLHVEESILKDGSREFILKLGHKTISGEIELRDEEADASTVVTVSGCWNLVAQDLSLEQVNALGWQDVDEMRKRMNWDGDEWGTTPITVIQVARD